MSLTSAQRIELANFIDELLPFTATTKGTSLAAKASSMAVGSLEFLRSWLSTYQPLVSNPVELSLDIVQEPNPALENIKNFLVTIFELELFTADEFRKIPTLNEHALEFFNVPRHGDGSKLFLLTNKKITFTTIRNIDNGIHDLLNPIKLNDSVTEIAVAAEAAGLEALRLAEEVVAARLEALRLAEEVDAARLEVLRIAEVEAARLDALRIAEEVKAAEVERAAAAFQQQKSSAETVCVARLLDAVDIQIERIERSTHTFGPEKAGPLKNARPQSASTYKALASTLDNNQIFQTWMKFKRINPFSQSTSHTAITKLHTIITHDHLSMTSTAIPNFAQTVTLGEIIRTGIKNKKTLSAISAISAEITTFFDVNPDFKVGFVKLTNGTKVLSSMVLRAILKEVVTEPTQRQTILEQLMLQSQAVTPPNVTTNPLRECLAHYGMYQAAGERPSKKSTALLCAIDACLPQDGSPITMAQKTNLIRLMHKQHHFTLWINDQHPVQKTCSHLVNSLYGLESSEDCHELYKDLMALSTAALTERLALDFPQGNVGLVPPIAAEDRTQSSAGSYFKKFTPLSDLSNFCRQLWSPRA